MPIQWTVSHAERLVIAKVSGDAYRTDFERYLAEIQAAGLLSYRKILDMTFAPLSMRAADIKAIGRIIVEYAKNGPLGAFAIVVDADATHEASTLFGETTRVDRPFAIFGRMAEARAWLDGLKEPGSRG
jgi:hypothetical protein